MAIIQASDVDDAIRIARGLQQKYNGHVYFRGHTSLDWKVVSTATRRNYGQSGEHEEHDRNAFIRFLAYLKETPEISYLNEAQYADHVPAILQHYGRPTYYIDFTEDPEIAAFFATCDPKSNPGDMVCIVCLTDTDVICIDVALDRYRKEGEHFPPTCLIQIDVRNLWRLQAQKGLFLFMPAPNLEEFLPLSRIVFPYSGRVTKPSDREIYPDRKSPLEILLDSYFDNELRLTTGKRVKAMFEEQIKQNDNASMHIMLDPFDSMHEYITSNAVAHPSWNNIRLSQWRTEHVDHWHKVQSQEWFEVPSTVFEGRCAESMKEIGDLVNKKLTDGTLQRSRLVQFKLSEALRRDFGEMKTYMLKCMHRMWDGMRLLPFTNGEIAESLAVLTGIFVNVYQDGITQFMHTSSSNRRHWTEIVDDPLRLELSGSLDFGISRCVADRRALCQTLRPDLLEVLRSTHRYWLDDLHKSIPTLMMAIPSPDMLFEYDALQKLFVSQIIPSQIFLRSNRDTMENPVFYSPAELNRFGLA